ncbi:alkaline phosphatase family protein [Novosphingobium panipatense]|uniref:alkaline phosphatase family protein n=2 Tax=Novosphingobium TaxID=165696 RepID=UPI00399F54CB
MRTIVLEFNELSPQLLDRFIEQGHLPNFRRFRDSAMVAVTDAEETAPNLEPWVQWVTVHTGLSFAEHGCFNLNEGSDLTAPRLWDLVSRADQTNWICGSMNAAVQPGFRGCFLPDPWATSAEPVPLNMFRPYARLVRSYVQEHSGRPEVSPVDVLRFGQFMLRHGLSASSVAALIKQLAQERRRDVKWRRAMMLDRLQWDVFRSVYKSMQPYLSTFFINSTAHFQHFHWREFEPGLFRIQSSEKQRQTYGDAILAGYQNMDRIVGEALSMARDEANLVLLTALSQQPMLTHEEDGGRQIFRHRDIKVLLELAGVEQGWTYAPIMSQQFLLYFQNEQAAKFAAARIEALRLTDGRQPMWARRKGSSLDAGCMIEKTPPAGIRVVAPNGATSADFFDIFYPLDALRSGKHHPEGAFWIKGPGVASAQVQETVSLRMVAPTLADLLEVPGEFKARSLFAEGTGRAAA